VFTGGKQAEGIEERRRSPIREGERVSSKEKSIHTSNKRPEINKKGKHY